MYFIEDQQIYIACVSVRSSVGQLSVTEGKIMPIYRREREGISSMFVFNGLQLTETAASEDQ